MKTSIVVGLYMGDEGKGITTDYLCSLDPLNTVVVRYAGGSQCGHTVVKGELKHVFSSFGSGTLAGSASYLSNYCAVDPIALMNEYNGLREKGIYPMLYVDNLCPVITPYDRFYNQAQEILRGEGTHGSCGMGFGATMHRSLNTPYKIFVQDFTNPFVLQQKLNAIYHYYYDMLVPNDALWRTFMDLIGRHERVNSFKESCSDLVDCRQIKIIGEQKFFNEFNNNRTNFVFEGAQGVMLDMDFGFFPHVTYSNTTSKNAHELIKRNGLSNPIIYNVTRTYQTRHGSGPMSDQRELFLQNNEDETNVLNKWQGNFKTGLLDINMLQYALRCDSNYSSGCLRKLVVTCVDQIVGEWQAIESGEVITLRDTKELADYLFNSTYDDIIESHSPDSKDMIVYKPKENA